MKAPSALIWILLFLSPIIGNSQDCPNLDLIVLSSQQEIDSFKIIYPDCISIPKTLMVTGAGINNLNGLSNIQEVGRSLVITTCPNLTTLEGLENLNRVANQFRITHNNNLQSLSGIPSLREVFDLILIENDNLVDLEGLNQLSIIEYALRLSDNDNLSSLKGLDNIETMDVLFIQNHPALKDLSGMLSLQSLLYELHLDNNDLISSLDDLADLEFSSSLRLYLTNNDNLVFCNTPNICFQIETASSPIIEIYNNSGDCTSLNTLIDICAAGCTVGLSCDDNDECTENDVIDSNCNCVGTLIDDDQDGICWLDDCDDNDNSVPTSPGTPCDDLNPNTLNDQILADGCTCQGDIIDTTCDNVSVEHNSSSIVITGLDFPIREVVVYDELGVRWYYCWLDCEDAILIENLPEQKYFILVKFWEQDYTLNCEKLFEVDLEDSNLVNLNIENLDFSIYPNPASKMDQLKITMDGKPDQHSSIKIYGTNGSIVKDFYLEDVEFFHEEINLHDWTPGIYYIQYVSQGSVKNKRFMVIGS